MWSPDRLGPILGSRRLHPGQLPMISQGPSRRCPPARETAGARRRPRWPTPNCSPCCCAPALPGTLVLQLAQELLDAFGGLAGLLHAGPDELSASRAWAARAKRAELAAVLELARRVAGRAS